MPLARVPENENGVLPKGAEAGVVCVGEPPVLLFFSRDLQTMAVSFLAFHLNCICMA